MLQLIVVGEERYDENTETFIAPHRYTLQLEHSLVSMSKWESTWLKPFFSKEDKTLEETLDYIRCMTITQNVNPEVYDLLSDENMRSVQAYIEHPMTATTFRKEEGKGGTTEIITSEIIYYWMVAHTIPFECQKWHLNRLLTLINVCNLKNQPQKKMSKRDIYSRNRSLNAARRASLGSRG